MVVWAACGKSEAPADAEQTSTQYVAGTTRQASPLAQLMLEMTAFADTTRDRLRNGQELPPFPDHFKEMLTVESTPGMVDHRVYDPFALAYLYAIDSLYKVPAGARMGVYNAVVQGCANCHGQVCPGPLVRIKKLYGEAGSVAP